MRQAKMLAGLLLVCGISLVGCGRKVQAQAPVSINGTSINVSAFQKAFASAPADLQSEATSIRLSLSYGDFTTTQRELAKLSANQNLSEPQKQAVSTLTEQVAQASANAAH